MLRQESAEILAPVQMPESGDEGVRRQCAERGRIGRDG